MTDQEEKTIGFIIIRHVTNELTNQYWNHCYDCIRKFYPENQVLIIDDNSNYEFVDERELYNATIIQGEYPGRGELLPYYYYLQNKLFDTAVILHDSAFINSYIDFTVETYKLLWEFNHCWDQIEDETRMIHLFNDPELLSLYQDKRKWSGCFGSMSVITHDYLSRVNAKYNISILLDCIISRYNRCSFERVIGCLLQKETDKDNMIMFGNIHEYTHVGLTFQDKDTHNHLPIIKVFTGR